MENGGKIPKKVEFISKSVDKPVETVDNFIHRTGCGKLFMGANAVGKSKNSQENLSSTYTKRLLWR